MADVTAVPLAVKTFAGRNSSVVLWEALTSANAAGSAVQVAGAKSMFVQFVGTFDSATIVLQGSNDNTNWVTLTDPQGNAISKTAAGAEQVEDFPRYVRPSTSGGGGTQDLDAYLMVTY